MSRRCSCGHVRSGHTGSAPSLRTPAGRVYPYAAADPYPEACALMCCACEQFRGELDR